MKRSGDVIVTLICGVDYVALPAASDLVCFRSPCGHYGDALLIVPFKQEARPIPYCWKHLFEVHGIFAEEGKWR